MKKTIEILIVLFLYGVPSSAQLVFNDGGYVVMNDSAKLLINNSDTSGIITLGTGGKLVSENEQNDVIWNVGNSTGTYTVPFSTKPIIQGGTGVEIPFTLSIDTAAADATGSIRFSTWQTNNSNVPYPSVVTNMMRSSDGMDGSMGAIDRFWCVTPSFTGTNPAGTASFGYDENEIGGGNSITEGTMIAQRYNASNDSWEGLTFGTVNTSSNTVSGISIPSNSFHANWILVDGGAPLPVELLNFEVECAESEVIISWETASEINSSHFIVERIELDKEPVQIARVNSSYYSNSVKAYQVTDDYFSSGNVYYRLKQFDFNGKSETYDMALLDCDKIKNTNSGFEIKQVYFSSNQLFFKIESHVHASGQIQLLDLNGKEVQNMNFTIMEGEQQEEITTNSLANSIYLVRFRSESHEQRLRVVKH